MTAREVRLDRDLETPAPVVAILARLEEAGYETWCVGGAIRDTLLGDTGQDVDLATAATPDVVRRLFRRTVAVGIEHGTVGVLDDDDVLHEVTTFRRDVRTDGRHAEVEFGVSLDDDLARRDFTINAVAYHPLRHEWRDPFDGAGDLRRGIVRAVGDPAARFREDRLRILRALRFAARFGFEIDEATWTAATAQAADTGTLSAERVREEWIKGVETARSVADLVQRWIASGVARVWFGECHRSDAAALSRFSSSPRDAVVATALWCRPAATVWRRLKGSSAEIRRAEAIDRGPERPVSAEPQQVRRWMATVGEAADDLIAIGRCRGGGDWIAAVGGVRS
ncbi:MAG: CCA tRNA nucleotidyltransferase, partial [Gemmatimonadales bacterium]